MQRAIDRWNILRPLVALLAAGALFGCAGPRVGGRAIASEASDWKFGNAAGRRILTDHYDIYTTITDEKLLSTFPELMERTFDYYQELIPPARAGDARMPIYLFATRPQWAYFTQRFTGPRAALFLKIRNGGYSERGVTVIQYVAHQITFPLMAHEGLHQYLHHYVNPQVPAWFNEGMAVVCEGQRWSSSGLRSFEPGYNPARQNALAEALLRDELLSLEELLDTNAGRVVGETSRKIAAYYAQVWALCLYLLEGEGGRFAEDFRQLREDLGRADGGRLGPAAAQLSLGRGGRALFEAYFGDDAAGFEVGYRRFLEQRCLGR